MSIQYLIPKPSVENAVNTGYKGTLIYSETNYSRNYYVLQKDTENAWWAIGMIAKVGRYDHPIIVSDQRKNVHTICDGDGSGSSPGIVPPAALYKSINFFPADLYPASVPEKVDSL